MKRNDELLGIAKLLGEENEKKLKDGIVELLLRQVEQDIEHKYQSYYILDFDDIFEEIQKDVESVIKEKVMEKYMGSIDKLIEERFKNV